MIYEVLTGQLPFGDQLEKLKDQRKLSSLKYRSAIQFNPMVPAWMDQALQRALSPQTELRQEAMSEFIFDLQRPNSQYKQPSFVPLSQRNPLKFWQVLSFVEAAIILAFLYYCCR